MLDEVIEAIEHGDILFLGERIRGIPRFDNYQVTNFGRVWTIKNQKWLKLVPDNDGYLVVSLYINGVRYVRKVHQLVLEAFVRDKKWGEQTRHLDGDKSNNNLDNLIWGDAEDNYNDRIKLGKDNNGENCGMSYLNNEEIIEIRNKYATGKYTQQDLANEYNVGRTNIQKIVNRLTWTHV